LGDPLDFHDALFDYGHATNGEEISSCNMQFSDGSAPKGMKSYLTELATQDAQARTSSSTAALRYVQDGSITVNIQMFDTYCIGQTAGFPFYQEQYVCNRVGEDCVWGAKRNIGSVGGRTRQGTADTAFTCPHPDRPNRRVLKYLDAAPFCFGQADLNTRDSCPDSTQDGAYVLPSNANNNEAVMCLDKPDGSSCKYEKTGNFYTTDFENDCYELNGLPRFNDEGINEPDPNDPECQNIGAGVTACIEDKVNVCDQMGNCQPSCGTFAFGGGSDLFMCLSGDTDGDGLPDYIDPDLDGDGIRNEDDLDKDGDGKDDPTYPKQDEGTTVNVDMGGVETRLDKIATLLDTTGLAYTGKTALQLKDESKLQLDAVDLLLTDAFDLTNEEMGGININPEEFEFVNTAIGKIPMSVCSNPVLNGYEVDFCSKAPMINDWLYWIVGFITIIALFHEANHTFRMQ
jgi:hypothetical protein